MYLLQPLSQCVTHNGINVIASKLHVVTNLEWIYVQTVLVTKAALLKTAAVVIEASNIDIMVKVKCFLTSSTKGEFLDMEQEVCINVSIIH